MLTSELSFHLTHEIKSLLIMYLGKVKIINAELIPPGVIKTLIPVILKLKSYALKLSILLLLCYNSYGNLDQN